ncbi:MAG: hypothetical protein PUC29_00500 [Clostridia bacterium]|nr:hypothetical protein [Clostridia bacterium]
MSVARPGKEPFLARTAEEVKHYSVLKKILISVLLAIILLIIIIYIIAALYTRFGSFTVSVNKYDATRYSLSLSETPQFETQISRLNAKTAEDITNISVNDLPGDLDSINGQHNGDNYLAYTFYLKNVGQDTVTFEYYMFITNVKNDVDKAIRIRIYRDGEDITYARTRSDGGGPESGCVDFLTTRSIVRNQVEDFKPGDVTKFSVVIWLEGDDPDCVDDLIGGSLKTDMTISVIEASSKDGK